MISAARRHARLRAFEAGDLDSVADLWVEAWSATMPDIDFAARLPWLFARLAELQARGVAVIVAVAAESETPLGFVTIDPKNGHLDQLAVARGQWGQGVADALMAEAKARAPGRVDLEVNTANKRAARFYARHGFRSVGEGLSASSGLPISLLRWSAEPGEG